MIQAGKLTLIKDFNRSRIYVGSRGFSSEGFINFKSRESYIITAA
jgi:hypothetical protein